MTDDALVDRIAHRINQAVILNPSQMIRVVMILREELTDEPNHDPDPLNPPGPQGR